MKEKGKIKEIARVIVCNSIDLQSKMNEVIEEFNEQNFTVKQHSITCKNSTIYDIICTIIFEEKKL